VLFLQRLDALQVEILDGDQFGVGMAEDGICGVVSNGSGSDEAKTNSG